MSLDKRRHTFVKVHQRSFVWCNVEERWNSDRAHLSTFVATQDANESTVNMAWSKRAP